MRRIWIFGAGLLALSSGIAQAQERPNNTIQVAGTGTIETAPEIASIGYNVRGEGPTSDDAVRALVARKQAIETAMGAVAGVQVKIETGDMNVTEVRGRECSNDEDDDAPRLSTGACAVIGYIATMQVSLDATPVAAAGTLTGLAARGGASEVRLRSFGIADRAGARRRAMARAVANGREQAEAIASASGARLGALLRVIDSESRGSDENDIVVTGSLGRYANAPAPVIVGIAPAAVTTTAQLTLVYEIAR